MTHRLNWKAKPWAALALSSLLPVFATPARAQVLARPGWAGSGVVTQAWWHDAVFYRVDPARFQDAGSTGVGNLAGLTDRLVYVQSLGVDALVLQPPKAGSADDENLEGLIRAASQHHLRVLLEISPERQAGDRQTLLRAVHDWVSEGAAGLWVPHATEAGSTTAAVYPALVASLTAVMRSLPGDRVLLVDPGAGIVDTVPETGTRPTGRARRSSFSGGQVTILTTAASVPTGTPEVAALRGSLDALDSVTGGRALVRFAEPPATGSPEAGVLATVLLGFGHSVMFSAGDEIGLNTYVAGAGQAEPPVMQWTPANLQQIPVEPPPEPAPTQPGGITPFGNYHPYVRPKPGSVRPRQAKLADGTEAPEPLPDANTLPGFTKGPLPNPPVDGAKLNVTTQDRNPDSLLNFYRQLIGLHTGNPALRDGGTLILDEDAQHALVWVRRASKGARNSADVLVAANPSDQTVTLLLDSDLQAKGVRPGILHPLGTFAPQPLTGETTGALLLPAHSVYVGEITPVRGYR